MSKVPSFGVLLAPAWNNLGSALINGAQFVDLAPEIWDALPGHAATIFSIQLAAFCFSKAIILEPNNAERWLDLYEAFKRGAKISDVCEELKVMESDADPLAVAVLANFLSARKIR